MNNMQLLRIVSVVGRIFLSVGLWLWGVHGGCYEPSQAFPPPQLTRRSQELKKTFAAVETSLQRLADEPSSATVSFSVELTTLAQTLWSFHHTAAERNPGRLGAPAINGSVAYRIASITKVFTVLGIIQQHAKGCLSLEDTVDQYIPELAHRQEGSIPWKDITLRSLASQLSGIPNDWAQEDLLDGVRDPVRWGLPPASKESLPSCEVSHEIPCTREDLLNDITKRAPLFPPNAQSTYSNLAFELLGLVLENVTGQSYEDYIATSILHPLNMTGTSFQPPPDSDAALPPGEHWWGVDEGVQNPTGGLYSTSHDLSVFLRHVLTHYNGLTPSLNWLQPFSWAMGIHSFYGMPWEIFRSSSILPHTQRPVTFVTKAGGLPGYTSNIIIMPEYGLGLTILVASDLSRAGNTLDVIREQVTVSIVRAAESVGQSDLQHAYAGSYSSSSSSSSSFSSQTQLNSSITFSQSHSRGLYVTHWVSNSTNVLEWPFFSTPGQYGINIYAQVVPTLLYADEERRQGEIWRIVLVAERPSKNSTVDYWDDFCITHVDNLRYAGIPLNEIVFWRNGSGQGNDRVTAVELTAFRVTLERTEDHQADPRLASQARLGVNHDGLNF